MLTDKKQQANVQLDLSKAETILCEKCGNDTFVQVYQMRKLSALLSPTGQETMIPIQVFACAKCGYINKGFQPKEEDDTV